VNDGGRAGEDRGGVGWSEVRWGGLRWEEKGRRGGMRGWGGSGLEMVGGRALVVLGGVGEIEWGRMLEPLKCQSLSAYCTCPKRVSNIILV